MPLKIDPPKLIVEQVGDLLECHREGDIGMCIVGRSTTVAGAVGDWCIHSQQVEVRCDPPELLKRYDARNLKEKHFMKSPSRGD